VREAAPGGCWTRIRWPELLAVDSFEGLFQLALRIGRNDGQRQTRGAAIEAL